MIFIISIDGRHLQIICTLILNLFLFDHTSQFIKFYYIYRMRRKCHTFTFLICFHIYTEKNKMTTTQKLHLNICKPLSPLIFANDTSYSMCTRIDSLNQYMQQTIYELTKTFSYNENNQLKMNILRINSDFE